jgi:hypothetical protein
MQVTREKDFWATTAILIATAFLMAATILHWTSVSFLLGPIRLNHWFVWIGTIYIAIASPIFAYLKRRSPKQYAHLRSFHVVGNSLGFMLISIHLASQISRPADRYPELGTGLVLYISMLLLVATGFLLRFQLLPRIKPQSLKFVHLGAAFAFYLIIIIHILHGIGIL